MVFLLIFAIFLTLYYINTLIAEVVNLRFNNLNNNNAKTHAIVRLFLIALMSITWGIYIHFG
jgi:hypothetical protein